MREHHLVVIALAAALLALVGVAGNVWAGYTHSEGSSDNEFVAAPDWVAPTAGFSVIQKSQGGTPGFVHAGGAYNVYANVNDTGNPASGIASVAGNVSTITSGQSAAPLSPGLFAIGGTAYGHRTAALTANAGLVAGAYTYPLTSTDLAGNVRTQSGYTVTVDNTAPTASDIQTTNKSGNIAGRPDIGDTVIFTFSEPIDPVSVLAGWTGATTNVGVLIENKGGALTHDTLSVYDYSLTPVRLPLGTTDLGPGDYVSADATFGATGTASTMVITGSTLTITLGTASTGPRTAAGTGAMIWSPSASAFDRAGNPESTSTRTETGTADLDF